MTESALHAAQVARILGVGRSRVGELLAEFPLIERSSGPPLETIPTTDHFPRPRIGGGGYRLWDRKAVESWAVMDAEGGLRGSRPRLPAMGRVAPQLEQVFALACEQARDLNHLSVEPHHLVLALAQPVCPGMASTVLKSLGLDVERLRRDLVAFSGDLFEPHDNDLRTAPAASVALARASLAAADLQDDEVASEHLLLVLGEERPAYRWSLIPLQIAGAPLFDRVLAVTEGATPLSELPPAEQPRQADADPGSEPDLARSPSGYDPRRRKPWRSALFRDPNGQPVSEGAFPRQYWIDRDGHPVLTTTGQPVHDVDGPDGTPTVDDGGRGALTPVDVPQGSRVESYVDIT